MVHSDILYCFLNVKKSPRFSELKKNVLSMNRFEKRNDKLNVIDLYLSMQFFLPYSTI